ncbi:hypothetical protein ACROAE_20160 [Shewanella sp. MF05960]|uniref:hypothetical protein n=1 Tax=Shewanella sp. MF05960 TaxID=3434874 RepID=UPI003D7BF481
MPASKLKYPPDEIAKQDQLNAIYGQLLATADIVTLPFNMTSADIVWEGFYPYYFSQRCKVLYIGWESLGLIGENYIDLMHHCYTIKKKINGKSINQQKFHRLKLEIAYGLNNGHCEFEKVPKASDICNNFAVKGGVSFAFLNLSKFSNESGSSDANWELINSSMVKLKSAQGNFFTQQIDLFEPDIIITMNLESKLNTLGKVSMIEGDSKASRYILQTETTEYPLIDTYHFSARNSPETDFYIPIMAAIEKFGLKF